MEFIQALKWTDPDPAELKIDFTGWSFRASSPEDARKALRALLEQNSSTLTQVYNAIDTSDDMTLDMAEFLSAMRETLGFIGEQWVLEQV